MYMLENGLIFQKSIFYSSKITVIFKTMTYDFLVLLLFYLTDNSYFATKTLVLLKRKWLLNS